MKAVPWRGVLALAALLVPARSLDAADVELAPFVGAQFGSFSPVSGQSSIGSGLDYGATANIGIAPSWRIELLYARQDTSVSGGPAGGASLSIERYMAGIQEEKIEDWGRLFGVFLMGLTRFAPGFDGYDADERFTLGLSLGAKFSLSERLGVRTEARGFFVTLASGGGILCRNGACLFSYSASGLFQGDLTAAVVMTF